MHLDQQEIQWLLERRINRLTDNHEVLIYPMGAERYLSSVLFGNIQNRYQLRSDIEGKRVLVIPGYANTGFLFAKAGGDVTVCDQDPVTIAWLKAFKKYYHYTPEHIKGKCYPSIGECLDALTKWYPPYLKLPVNQIENWIYWLLHPQFLRRSYIFYMITLVQEALKKNIDSQFELQLPITFHAGDINQLILEKESHMYDTAYVPYLLGVKNGIELETDIIDFVQKIFQLVPTGNILITPTNNTREFYLVGQRYFETTKYRRFDMIPGLSEYIYQVENRWFRTQGLIILKNTYYGR